jgi:diguanylate cyclase (GGDEF)-like protein
MSHSSAGQAAPASTRFPADGGRGDGAVHDEIEALLDLCVALEEEAAHWYADRARDASDHEQRALWERMARDEREHCAYWQRLRELARDGGLKLDPDEREVFHRHLDQNARAIRAALLDAPDAPDTETSLVVACRMESHMLQPAVIQLLNMVNPLMPCDVIGDYQEHITRLLGAIERFCPTPPLRLVADLMRTNWQDHMQLSDETRIDILTGALNKRGLQQALLPLAYLARREERRVAMLMLDLDRFKQVNDEHGHHIGDRALAFVGQVLRESLRRSDVVGRYGGEEFLVFLPDVDAGRTGSVAEKIRTAIHDRSRVESSVALTVSIGAVEGFLGEDVVGSVERFTREADAAMYRAKENGRNHVCACEVAPS